MEQKTFSEFLNEGLFRNFVGMALRSIGKWASEPLNDMMKDIKQSNSSKEIIKSLKTYVQKSSNSIKTELEKVKTVKNLKDFLHSELYGLYTAIKGVQSTQKVNNTYFNEIFKNADKRLIKAMSNNEKKASSAITNYINKDLYPNLENIAGVKKVVNKNNESFLFEAEQGLFSRLKGENVDDNQDGPKVDNQSGNNQDNDSTRQVDPKLKQVVLKWLSKILLPILNSKEPNKEEGNGEGNDEGNGKDFIDLGDGKHKIRRNVAQGVIRKAGFQKFKDFRNSIGDKNEFPL